MSPVSLSPLSPSEKVTIELPAVVFQQLMGLAEATQQPIETLVLQSVVSNLPPMLEKLPLEMRGELLAMQTMSIEALLAIAQSQIDPVIHQQHLELLSANRDRELTGDEADTLMGFQELCDRLMLKKAYAWAMLRWRGYPVPAMKDMPVAG